jgi:hypothetical protein
MALHSGNSDEERYGKGVADIYFPAKASVWE